MTGELKHLDEHRAAVLANLCETIVPGSRRVKPVVYIDAIMAEMPVAQRDALIHSIDELREAAPHGAEGLRPHAATPAFQFIRALAIEAFYSDFVAPGRDGAGRLGGDRLPPAAGACAQARTGPTWGSKHERALRRRRRRLGRRRRRVRRRARRARALGAAARGSARHYAAADFSRWEAQRPTTSGGRSASRCRPAIGGPGRSRSIAGRCVGGIDDDQHQGRDARHAARLAKWHAASGLPGDGGEPFSARRPRPLLRPRRALPRRARSRTDWDLERASRRSSAASTAVGATLEPVRVLHRRELRCAAAPACRAARPTRASRRRTPTSSATSAFGSTDRAPELVVDRVLIDARRRSEATGVRVHSTRPPASATRSTPTSWSSPPDRSTRRRCCCARASPTRSSARNLGFHPARIRVRPLRRAPGRSHGLLRSPATATTSPPTRTAGSPSRR